MKEKIPPEDCQSTEDEICRFPIGSCQKCVGGDIVSDYKGKGMFFTAQGIAEVYFPSEPYIQNLLKEDIDGVVNMHRLTSSEIQDLKRIENYFNDIGEDEFAAFAYNCIATILIRY